MTNLEIDARNYADYILALHDVVGHHRLLIKLYQKYGDKVLEELDKYFQTKKGDVEGVGKYHTHENNWNKDFMQ